MYFVLLAAAIAILVGVVVVAMGRGGEMAMSHRDAPTAPPEIRSAADLALLRLPMGLFGYQEQATDEALDAAARLIAEQEAEIARLREEVWRRSRLRADARTERSGSDSADQLGPDGGPDTGRGTGQPTAAGVESEDLPSPDPVGGQSWQQP